MQRSVMLNNEFLQRKSTAAGIVDVNQKISQVLESRYKNDQEVLNTFVHNATMREK